MLNQVDLGTKMKKEELKEVLDEKLGYELGKAQRHARAAGMPVSWNLPSDLLSRASSRSPWSTLISTLVWLSAAVE